MMALITAVVVVMLTGCRDEEQAEQQTVEGPAGQGGAPATSDRPLAGMTVAVLVADEFEDSELAKPVEAVQKAGAGVVLVAAKAGQQYTGKNGEVTVTSDRAAGNARAEQFDGLVIPGGHAPATMRENQDMVRLVREMVAAGKPVAAICHGPQVLVTAGVLEGLEATCYRSVRGELEGAGAEYHDLPVIVDSNIITSRHPGDLAQFNAALIRALSRQRAGR
ncbi:MAG: type 1 glutamine amidotransferase domain-containing protein [Armatimonadota bacterium]|nr:type 1 glutamine amidotransferase domain-containing protein [Armatimonadota bacterium]